MNDKKPVAAYPFPQVKLWQRCQELQVPIARDAKLLEALGISLAMQVKFAKDTEIFGEMDPDAVLVQEGATVTEAKSAEEVALITAIQTVMSRVGLKDDERTPAYKRFGAAHVSNLTEAALHLAGTMVVKQATKYLAEYTAQGLTQALIDDVEARNAAFVGGLSDSHEAGNTRAIATNARLLFGNDLYRQGVAIGAAGVAQWRFTDEAKTNEYVLDAAVHSTLPVPPKP